MHTSDLKAKEARRPWERVAHGSETIYSAAPATSFYRTQNAVTYILRRTTPVPPAAETSLISPLTDKASARVYNGGTLSKARQQTRS